jgi:ssRNA-specific RNase YbeY (16S rRNA maturation enzyme)
LTSKTLAKIVKDCSFEIQVINRQKRYRIVPQSISCFCATILQECQQNEGALTIVFVGSHKMKELNRHYRNKDYPTDVLSFGYDGTIVEGVLFLGEIIISPEIARRQKWITFRPE